MPNIYQIGFISYIVYIIYCLIIKTIATYNQIKNSDIFIADSGTHYYPDTDLETDINANINSYNFTDVETYNDMEFSKYKNCILCKLIGLDLIDLN